MDFEDAGLPDTELIRDAFNLALTYAQMCDLLSTPNQEGAELQFEAEILMPAQALTREKEHGIEISEDCIAALLFYKFFIAGQINAACDNPEVLKKLERIKYITENIRDLVKRGSIPIAEHTDIKTKLAFTPEDVSVVKALVWQGFSLIKAMTGTPECTICTIESQMDMADSVLICLSNLCPEEISKHDSPLNAAIHQTRVELLDAIRDRAFLEDQGPDPKGFA